jgi:hypothetical protein
MRAAALGHNLIEPDCRANMCKVRELDCQWAIVYFGAVVHFKN